jgi:endonuclease/exonuclease/phosphatase family metal-dependent hydrolase
VARIRRALIAGGATLGILTICSGTIAPDPPVPPTLTLRFVTFNLLHGGIFSELSGDDEALEERLRMVQEGLRALDADVVGLQEASSGRRRGDVAARLAAALGYHHVQAPAAYRPLRSEHIRRGVQAVLGFSEGPALLSRFPIARWEAHELPRCGRHFDVRVLVVAELETPAGRLAAFSAHTSGEPCHARAVAALVRAKAGALPAVVMGDFNAVDTSPAMRILTREAGWVDTFRHANPAAPGFTEGQDVEARQPTASRRIDYVLLVPGARVPGRIVASRTVLDWPRGKGPVRWPSDHHGVLTDIALDGETRAPLAGGRTARDLARSRGTGG